MSSDLKVTKLSRRYAIISHKVTRCTEFLFQDRCPLKKKHRSSFITFWCVILGVEPRKMKKRKYTALKKNILNRRVTTRARGRQREGRRDKRIQLSARMRPLSRETGSNGNFGASKRSHFMRSQSWLRCGLPQANLRASAAYFCNYSEFLAALTRRRTLKTADTKRDTASFFILGHVTAAFRRSRNN